MKLAAISSAILFLVAVPLGGPTEAAYYHDLQRNRQPCSDCHILHYGEGSAQVEPGGPFRQLLVRASTNKLCLFCHDGSDPKAPDVLAQVTMYVGSGDEHSGAGFFANSGGVANPNGHDLGLSNPTPFGSPQAVTLTCASCHDPHGTTNYRNLLTAPAGGVGVAVEMGKDVFRQLPPGDPPSAAASIAAYKESNEGYKANTSRWCVECHGALKPHVAGSVRVENHHLVDVPINGWVPPVTDAAHWEAGAGSGFGVATGDEVEGVPRLRFQAPGATDFTSSKAASQGNQVLCASCHLAHGGNYLKGLVWPHLETGSSTETNSGCQQCHNR